MATPIVLGLDIGGANLKAATPDKRAVSVPFPLWKQPDQLPTALAELVAKFPDAEELAVTMTGELCDCFETKREGVSAIVDAVAACGLARFWSTDGTFVSAEEAKANHMKVAAANWHALATFAGRFAPTHGGLLLDIGSTTTDIIPLLFGVPSVHGMTDQARLAMGELVYTGVRRTPVCVIKPAYACAELFATSQDVYVILGRFTEEPGNTDTADGRPLTIPFSYARLARVLGGDTETLTRDVLREFASRVHREQVDTIACEVRNAFVRSGGELDEIRTVIVSGSGEFLARDVLAHPRPGPEQVEVISLNDQLGPTVSACVPAYAVAVLATERRA